MELSKAIDWLCEYASSLLNDESSGNNELHLKAIGEISLFLMVIKNDFKIDMGDMLNDFHIIASELCQKLQGYTDDKLAIAQINLCMYKYGIKNSLDRDDLEVIYSFQNKTAESIELAYLFGILGQPMPEKYWDGALVNIIYALLKENEDKYRLYLYHLTHIIFFGTEFGTKKIELENKKINQSLIDLINLSIDKCIIDKDWDLAVELILSKVFLSSSKLWCLDYDIYTERIFKNQRKDGSFISDGNISRDIDFTSSWNRYSVFHTTTITVMLYLCKFRD